MAEVENKLVVASPQTPAGQGEDTFMITEFDASGAKKTMVVPMPTSVDFAKWSIQQQVGMLKRGPWSKIMIADIYFGLAYAHHIGADVMQGDLYPVGEGRFGTSNKFKIKQGFATGKIESFDVDIRDTGEKVDLPGCIQKTDLECTVTLEVKGLKKPIVRKARLSRWWNAKNPNWSGRPEHMLELNTFAHACEYIPGKDGIPTALITEEDEAPPPETFVMEKPTPTTVMGEVVQPQREPEPVMQPPVVVTEVKAQPIPVEVFPPRRAEPDPVNVHDLVAYLKREVAEEKARQTQTQTQTQAPDQVQQTPNQAQPSPSPANPAPTLEGELKGAVAAAVAPSLPAPTPQTAQQTVVAASTPSLDPPPAQVAKEESLAEYIVRTEKEAREKKEKAAGKKS